MNFQLLMNADKHRYKQVPKIRFFSAFICVHLWLLSCLVPIAGYAQETLTVAVASSLYPVMREQVKVFEQEHHVTVRLVPGSTGRLYNQIEQGAPFDLFVAADKERPAMLAKQGKAVAILPAGHGYLGIMVGKQVVAELGDLTNPSIHHIAIANPDVAPFGRVTRAILQKRGLWDVLQHKFVYAQNAMQAAMMVDKGLVDAGMVPVVLSKNVIAVINYYGVLLNDKNQSRALLGMFERGEITSGSAALAAPKYDITGAPKGALPDVASGAEAQGECCLQQRELHGVLASLEYHPKVLVLK